MPRCSVLRSAIAARPAVATLLPAATPTVSHPPPHSLLCSHCQIVLSSVSSLVLAYTGIHSRLWLAMQYAVGPNGADVFGQWCGVSVTRAAVV